jgi:hypothetical protein
MYRFVSATPGVVSFDEAEPPKTPAQAVINNVLVHVPTEAVTLAVALTPLAMDNGKASPVGAWILFGCVLLLMIVVRVMQKATVWVWITSAIAFLLWMALVPQSALQLQFPVLVEHPNWALMVASAYSAIVTAVGSLGKIK